jgi:CRP-like cAMP-binding protein
MTFQNLFNNWEDMRTFNSGQAAFEEGDTADAMYFILEGEMEIQRRGSVMSVEGPGGIIGESALLDGATHNGTAVARSDAQLARLDRGQLKKLMDRDADFALHVMARLALRLRSVDARIGARIESADRTDDKADGTA